MDDAYGVAAAAPLGFKRKFKPRLDSDVDSSVDPDAVASAADDVALAAKLDPKADVGMLPEMRASHDSRFLQATCSGDFIDCVNGDVSGTATACSNECNDKGTRFCCDGANACTGFTGILCKDSANPPCSGANACANANIGVVDAGCDGEEACYAANIGSVVEGCKGQFACSEVAYYEPGVSQPGYVGQIFRSCIGQSACEYMAGSGYTSSPYGDTSFIPGGNVTRVVDSCTESSACER